MLIKFQDWDQVILTIKYYKQLGKDKIIVCINKELGMIYFPSKTLF
jgi:hypothetical protein